MGDPAKLLCHSPFEGFEPEAEVWVTHSAPPAAEPITVEAIIRACEALRSAVEPATPGFEVSIRESTGQGYQAFAEAMKQADDDLMFALVGGRLAVNSLPEPSSRRSDELSWNMPLPRPVYSANFPVILHDDSSSSSSFTRRPLKRRRLGSAAHRRFLRRQARQQ